MGAARCFGLRVRQFGSKLSAPGVSLSQVPEGMTSGRRQKEETSAALQVITYERPGEAITIQPDFLLKKKKSQQNKLPRDMESARIQSILI